MNKRLLPLLLLIVFSVNVKVFGQYCFPTFTSACTSADFINNFSTTLGISNITNNNTGCNGVLPNNYIYNSGMTVSQLQGQSVNFSIQSGATWAQGFRIWIDWNNNLSFADPGEDVWVSAASSTAVQTGTINVPISATPGVKRMRVICRWAVVPAITDYCGTGFSFGECEDYNFQVISTTPCSGIPVAGTATASPTNPCPGVPVSLNLTGVTAAGNLFFQWWRSTTPNGPWVPIPGSNSTSIMYTPPAGSTTYYTCVVTCQNSGGLDTATVAGPVIVQPFSPTSPCYCNTSAATSTADEEITNVTIGTL
ncbi:MAG TPA: hypothetical protein DCF44_11560, partial [Chitinophagaceae bacterium]|nr:hypothetical protein [Chitinophagaceae bacterium]